MIPIDEEDPIRASLQVQMWDELSDLLEIQDGWWAMECPNSGDNQRSYCLSE
jgi:hypothetical protein